MMMKSEDLISRQAAIEISEMLFKELKKDTVDMMGIGYNHAVSDSIAILKNLPTAEPHWIPVTEGLPVIENNIGKRVLVTTSWGMVAEAWFCKDHWEIHDMTYKFTSVVSWMPLPAPWKGGAK